MILYGGRLSSFVRRVELWLALQDRPVERVYASAFAEDFGGLLAVNPLGRVPVLATNTGESLFETSAIIDYLEDTADPTARLIPHSGPERWRVMQILALSHGISEKAIALYYETEKRPSQYQWEQWQARLSTQISNGLAALDEQIAAMPPSRAIEIAVCCAYDINAVTSPALVSAGLSHLKTVSETANRHPDFARTYPRLA